MSGIPKSNLVLALLLVSLLALLLALHLSQAPEGSDGVHTSVAHQLIADILNLFGEPGAGEQASVQAQLPQIDRVLEMGIAVIALLLVFCLLRLFQQRSRSKRS